MLKRIMNIRASALNLAESRLRIITNNWLVFPLVNSYAKVFFAIVLENPVSFKFEKYKKRN